MSSRIVPRGIVPIPTNNESGSSEGNSLKLVFHSGIATAESSNNPQLKYGLQEKSLGKISLKSPIEGN